MSDGGVTIEQGHQLEGEDAVTVVVVEDWVKVWVDQTFKLYKVDKMMKEVT